MCLGLLGRPLKLSFAGNNWRIVTAVWFTGSFSTSKMVLQGLERMYCLFQRTESSAKVVFILQILCIYVEQQIAETGLEDIISVPHAMLYL